jgi:hypothetical protein
VRQKFTLERLDGNGECGRGGAAGEHRPLRSRGRLSKA